MVRFLVPLLPVLPVCLVMVQLLSPCSADFAVLGPPEPILVMVGEDAHLPCHLSPKLNAGTMNLMWVRPRLRQVVHRYAHGQEDTPAEEYQGRTLVLREDVTVGKAALQIRNVSASDNGTYLCYFQDRDFSAKAQVELQVAALGSSPYIKMKGYEAGGVRVNCMSAGWYPPPQIEWRDARGQRISDEVVTEAADPQGLYAASASVVLEEGSGEEVSCVIRNPLLGQERSAWLSIPAMNRIYFEFGQEVPKSHWRMFMRLAGLEENDIVICEHENPGNLREQHHTIATPSRLMTALCQMRLRECLENITNKLVAEDILGSKDAEPPN
ncbi:butyrophilin subfamily 3 member A2-like isoform X4 [Sturnira hondurensis]|uniref:butyrophilin subfamily 3 member A2-like isoform X3 n=1 Tax=Sturnira hondurensis TaxID=192404 RepID=UPI0018795F1C|nr:butyrophilin subfamily 3 member A2-like isoform X3 [Sturnira hondurensis]XP_036903679.1 butyrophilin subfamily 3 member A2-like isoform X4 [Sturnira hondurensis]